MAIALQGFTNMGVGTATSVTTSVTVSSGSDLGLLVMGYLQAADDVTGFTFNSVAMTQIAKYNDIANSEYIHYAYYLPNPDVTTANVVGSFANSRVYGFGVWVLTGVQQSTTEDSSGQDHLTSNGTSLNISITTVADNTWIFSSWGQNVGVGTYSPSNVITNGRVTANRMLADSDGAVTPAGAKTATGSYTSANKMNGLCIALAPVAASGPANMKTWDGLAKASVKTMDGLAIASVKTWNGLA